MKKGIKNKNYYHLRYNRKSFNSFRGEKYMKKHIRTTARAVVSIAASAALFGTALVPAVYAADNGVLNIYSARHYKGDKELYDAFTEKTGIKINRVDGKDAGIVQRLETEGASSPADIILLVDAARLWRAEQKGLFQPVSTPTLESRIPEQYKGTEQPNGEHNWYGFSSRARVIIYNKARFKPSDVDTYEKLADPKFKGQICIRTGSHPYNLSLFGAILENNGEAKTQEWLKGIVANMARAPKGGDTDQIRGVGSGECGVAIANSYYVARLMKSDKPRDKKVVESVGVVFPNQNTWGTHTNIAGGAIAKHSPNKANAIAFLEFLSGKTAQNYFANGNNEWPTAKGVTIDNAALTTMIGGDSFKVDETPIGKIGANQRKVQSMLDRAGFK